MEWSVRLRVLTSVAVHILALLHRPFKPVSTILIEQYRPPVAATVIGELVMVLIMVVSDDVFRQQNFPLDWLMKVKMSRKLSRVSLICWSCFGL